MNKNLIIGIIIVVALTIGGGAYWVMTTQSSSIDRINDSLLDDTLGQKSLRELMAFTTPQRCTFSEIIDGNTNDGVVYIGGGKMRSDFNSTANGQVFNGHMITVNNNVNFWLEGETKGLMIGLDQTPTAEAANGPTAIDINKKIDVECEPWNIDETKFDLPTNVTFTDFGAAIQELMPVIPEAGNQNANVTAENEATITTDQTTDQKCSICDQVPAEKREQCRQAFDCQ